MLGLRDNYMMILRDSEGFEVGETYGVLTFAKQGLRIEEDIQKRSVAIEDDKQ